MNLYFKIQMEQTDRNNQGNILNHLSFAVSVRQKIYNDKLISFILNRFLKKLYNVLQILLCRMQNLAI